MIEKIIFENYKSFKTKQELELKPITILIGKNSSGKSAVAKLPTLIENSLSEKFSEPILYTNNGIELGVQFRDLVYGKAPTGILSIKLVSSDVSLDVKIGSGIKGDDQPKVVYWKFNEKAELVYNDTTGTYKNEIDQENYQCSFKGFKLDLLIDKDGSGKNLPLPNFNISTDYIGPFRIIPPRIFTLTGQKFYQKVGIKGENAYQIIANDSISSTNDILKSVSSWYKENFEGWSIKVNQDSIPFYQIELARESPDFNVNIIDVGQGMSQALPLILRAYMPTGPLLIILEQPELHLHPSAHGNLAELFAESTSDKNKRYLIETHSPNFVLRLRRLIVENKFDQNNLAIYWVDYDEETNSSNLKKINVNQLGEVDFWPENIFSEALDEAIGISTAQKNKATNGN